MKRVEIAPGDIPNPWPEVLRKVGEMPVAPIAFVSQPLLEPALLPGHCEGHDGRGRHMMHVSLTYVLLRNPADRAAPENLAEMNDDTRVASESPLCAGLARRADRADEVPAALGGGEDHVASR